MSFISLCYLNINNCMHCLDMDVICIFVLFKQGCCMFIHVVYTWKLYTRLSCLNNAQHLCLTNMNLWNNRFLIDLKRTHEACKFVMMLLYDDNVSLIESTTITNFGVEFIITFFNDNTQEALYIIAIYKPLKCKCHILILS
jgi:hypothetical protein